MSAPRATTQAFVTKVPYKLPSGLTWTTDTGRMYFTEPDSPNGQYPIGGLEIREFTFAETSGDGVYTAEVVVPAGYSVLDVLFGSTVVWNAGTSADLVVGDADDPDGYIGSTDVKTTPTADTDGAWGLNLEIANRPYRAGKYYAAAGLVTATITKVGNGTNGRSRLAVLMVPGAKTVTAVAKV